MTLSVTFSPSVGGDGTTYTDDSDPYTGLGNGGHRTRFIPALANIVGVGGFVAAQALAAAGSATAANNAASAAILSAVNCTGTSTTTLTSGLGSKSLVTQAGKNFYVGQLLKIYNSDALQMVGNVTAYNSGTGAMTVSVTWKRGSTSASSWSITICSAVVEYNMQASNSNSTSSLALGLGSKALTVELDKGFVPGNHVSLYNDTAHQMTGSVASYNVDTGAMVVDVTWVQGSGTLGVWTVAVSNGVEELNAQVDQATLVAMVMA